MIDYFMHVGVFSVMSGSVRECKNMWQFSHYNCEHQKIWKRFLKPDNLAPPPVSHSVIQGRRLRICLSNKFPVDVAAADHDSADSDDLQITFCKQLP